MAVKGLQKPMTATLEKDEDSAAHKFISQGGSTAVQEETNSESEDHRLTLRIPKWLLEKIDCKRKMRVGTISRNLWILEQIEQATKD